MTWPHSHVENLIKFLLSETLERRRNFRQDVVSINWLSWTEERGIAFHRLMEFPQSFDANYLMKQDQPKIPNQFKFQNIFLVCISWKERSFIWRFNENIFWNKRL